MLSSAHKKNKNKNCSNNLDYYTTDWVPHTPLRKLLQNLSRFMGTKFYSLREKFKDVLAFLSFNLLITTLRLKFLL